jgi:hypothetical protein
VKVFVKHACVIVLSNAIIHGMPLGLVYLNAGLLARRQHASGKSCDLPNQYRFSVVFLCPRVNANFLHKIHVTLNASNAALPKLT